MRSVELLTAIVGAIRSPTGKQKDGYARLAHTFAAASLIGAVTVVFTEAGLSWPLFWRLIGLTASGVVCFLCGALLLASD